MVPVKLRTPDAVAVSQWLTVGVREERREELNVVLRLLLPLPPLLDPLERALRVRLRMGVALPLGTGVTVLFLVEVAAREGTAAEGRAAGLALDVFVVVCQGGPVASATGHMAPVQLGAGCPRHPVLPSIFLCPLGLLVSLLR